MMPPPLPARRPRRRCRTAALIAVFVAAGTAAGAARQASSAEVLSLEGPWRYAPGDDLARAAPDFDDRDWAEVSLPLLWSRRHVEAEWVWYRKEVFLASPVREQGSDWPLSWEIGAVNSAYEAYAGGELLGGAGSLPPRAAADYDRWKLLPIPSRAVDATGRLVLALRVWRDPATGKAGGGPTEGRLRLGPLSQLADSAVIHDALPLAGAILFGVFGLFSLDLARRLRDWTYLWFGLLSTGFGGYTFLRTQWKYTTGLDFVILKEVEYALLFVLPAIFFELLWRLLDRRVGKAVRAFQVIDGVVVAIAIVPGLRGNFVLLPVWEAMVLAGLGATVVVLTREALKGNQEARLVGLSMSLGALAIANDIAVDYGAWHAPRVAWIGFGLVIGALAASIVFRLLRAHAELTSLQRSLESQVEARTQELTAASAAKSRFLATMSHEIRTPLASVLGHNSLLVDSPLSVEQREWALGAQRSGQVLLSLLDDLLDMTRIESGRLQLERVEFDLAELVEEAIEVVAERAAEKGLDLAYDVAPEAAACVGDPRRLRQVLVNLLANAVKFTDSGYIWVEAAETRSGPERRLRIDVADSGVGIGKLDAERLFEAFTQVDSSFARRHGGAGLGLAISRGLVECMGGELTLRSELGRGSTFTISLPGEIVVDGSEGPETSSRQGLRVLLVGLRPASRRAVERWLRRWGSLPIMAPVDLSRSPAFDLALVDTNGDAATLALWRDRIRTGGVAQTWVALRPRVRGNAPARDEAPSAGTLWLPLRAHELRRALSAPTLAGVRKEQAGTADEPRRFPGLSVLVAEDDASNRAVVRLLLGRLGVKADLASDGREALAATDHRAYDVIFLDLQMPGLDGFEVAKRLRQRPPRGGRPRIVALTANAFAEDRERCREVGMDGYLAKPVDLRSLSGELARSTGG